MTLSTAFTEMFEISHPIALAPMGGSAGGALAAAVSNAGGLGLLGSGNGGPGVAGAGTAAGRRRNQPALGGRLPELGDRSERG